MRAGHHGDKKAERETSKKQMKIFCTDLDNTLIYSYKREIGEKKRCVEIYKGKEASFITEKSFRLLKGISEKIAVVPVTTRTVEQYQRINLGIGVPEYALTCNGGVLLKDGERDMGWYYHSLKLAEMSWDELWEAQDILKNDKDRSMEVQFIEQLFVFTKSSQPEKTVHKLREGLDLNKIDIFSNGVKIYAVPKNLTKGKAVRRLKSELGINYLYEKGHDNIINFMVSAGDYLDVVEAKDAGFDLTIIAAGDSEPDLGMIEAADIGIIPKRLEEKLEETEQGKRRLEGKYVVIGGEEIYSDKLLEYIFEQIK